MLDHTEESLFFFTPPTHNRFILWWEGTTQTLKKKKKKNYLSLHLSENLFKHIHIFNINLVIPRRSKREILSSTWKPYHQRVRVQGSFFVSFYSTRLNSEIPVLVRLCYTSKKNVSAEELGKEPQTLRTEAASQSGGIFFSGILYLSPDGSRVKTLWPGRVLSFSILWAPCRHIASSLPVKQYQDQSQQIITTPSLC